MVAEIDMSMSLRHRSITIGVLPPLTRGPTTSIFFLGTALEESHLTQRARILLKYVMTISPDKSAGSLTAEVVDPLRYEGLGYADPHEVPGMFHMLVPKNVRVLDVGCGTGSITILANQGKSNEIVGIEPDADRAVVARGRGIDVREVIFSESLVIELGKFDVVTSSDVLEHVLDPGEMLRLFAEALNPGGRVIVSVPNVAHWSVRFALLFGRFDYQASGIMDATHVRWFTTKSLTQLFERSGFYVSYVGHTAGTWMGQYDAGLFRFLPRKVVSAVLKRSVRFFPGLLGCQHVVEARLSRQ